MKPLFYPPSSISDTNFHSCTFIVYIILVPHYSTRAVFT
jgi:hypothetical protein